MTLGSRLSELFKPIIIIAQGSLVLFFFAIAGAALLNEKDLGGSLGLALAGVGVAALLVVNVGWASPSIRVASPILIFIGLLVFLLSVW